MLRLIKRLFLPFTLVVGTISWLIQRQLARRVLKKSGWAELRLEGEIVELSPQEDFRAALARRLMRRREPRRVVLEHLRALANELASDEYAKGIVVRLGSLGGGWAKAQAVREALGQIRAAGREVIIFIPRHVLNREWLVATAGTEIWMTPGGALAAIGTASSGRFLKRTLEKFGVRVEVAAQGRFKSSPEQFTREDRSEADRQQTQALVDALDEALVTATSESRSISRQEAESLFDGAPYVGEHAQKLGHVDRVVRDEDLLEDLQLHRNMKKPPQLVSASEYLSVRRPKSPWPSKKKHVGVVEVCGTILDERPPVMGPTGPIAIERSIVRNLRAAREDKSIGAVVLYVDSRGGSAVASDVIWSAVKRLDREKPVIAYLADYAASGGYYVACGARSIIASPLTITGSIGVYSMLPTWPDLADRWGVGRDVVKNRRHADLYDPWNGLSDEARAHANAEVGFMYAQFLQIVAEARDISQEQANELAQGRVWTGTEAHAKGLVDGLGGLQDALSSAREQAGERFNEEPVIIHSRKDHPRPEPFIKDAAQGGALWNALLVGAPPALRELAMLWFTMRGPLRAVAYAPLDVS